MDLYAFMSLVQERLEIPMSQGEKEKYVGTLKSAGYRDLNSKEDLSSALKVVTALIEKKRSRLERLASTKVAAVEAASDKKSKFNELDQLNKKGLCGKCKSPMETVKLADLEEANYCTACRVTLWK